MAELTPEQRKAVERIARRFKRQIEGLGVDMTISGTLSDGTKVTARIPRRETETERQRRFDKEAVEDSWGEGS